MVPVAQETTANTVRLPYSFSRRFSLVAWCEASLEILHVHPLSLSVLQELQRGLNAPFTLRQIDEAEFEQRLNAVWQRDSSEARQLMEDLGSAEDFFTLAEELPETEDLLESDDDAPIIKLAHQFQRLFYLSKIFFKTTFVRHGFLLKIFHHFLCLFFVW